MAYIYHYKLQLACFRGLLAPFSALLNLLSLCTWQVSDNDDDKLFV